MRKVCLLIVLLTTIVVCFVAGPAMARGGGDESFPDVGKPQTNKDLSPSIFFPVKGNYVAAGVGLRNATSGNIGISGIPASATIQAAYLYWSFLDNGAITSEATITLAGIPFTGTQIGAGPDTCWFRQFSRAFRADVTSAVTGNGTYAITGVASGGSLFAQGASLVVIYSSNSEKNRTIVIIDGNDVIRRENGTFGPPTILSQPNRP